MDTRSRRTRGQALAEFALIVPIFVLFLGGIVQFGIIFWAQSTLTQVARDTGRYAAAQTACISNQAGIVETAKTLAESSTLIGYPTDPAWSSENVVVSWRMDDGSDVIPSGVSRNCPPKTNATTAWVTIAITHRVPVFFPFIPGDGTISTSAEFRMEPSE